MKRVQKRGPARMAELGRKVVATWFDKYDYAALVKAAERAGEPVAQFVRRAAVRAALGYDPYALENTERYWEERRVASKGKDGLRS